VHGISQYADRVIPEAPLRITFEREPIARPRRAEVSVLREQLGQLAVEIRIGGFAYEDLAVQRDRASPLPVASSPRRLGCTIKELPPVVGSLELQHRG
jgi:hypothetical protein